MVRWVAVIARTAVCINQDQDEQTLFNLLRLKTHYHQNSLVGLCVLGPYHSLLIFCGKDHALPVPNIMVELDKFGLVEILSADEFYANALEINYSLPSSAPTTTDGSMSETDQIIANAVMTNISVCYHCKRSAVGWVLLFDPFGWHEHSSRIVDCLMRIPMLNLLENAAVRKPIRSESCVVCSSLSIDVKFAQYLLANYSSGSVLLARAIQQCCSEQWGQSIALLSAIPAFESLGAIHSKQACAVEIQVLLVIYLCSNGRSEAEGFKHLQTVDIVIPVPQVCLFSRHSDSSSEYLNFFGRLSIDPCSFSSGGDDSNKVPSAVGKKIGSLGMTIDTSRDDENYEGSSIASSPTFSCGSQGGFSDSSNASAQWPLAHKQDTALNRHIFCWWHYASSPLSSNQDLPSFLNNLRAVVFAHLNGRSMTNHVPQSVFGSTKHSNAVFLALHDFSGGNLSEANESRNDSHIQPESKQNMSVSLTKQSLQFLEGNSFRTLAYLPGADGVHCCASLQNELKGLLGFLSALKKKNPTPSATGPEERDTRPLLCMVCSSSVKKNVQTFLASTKRKISELVEIVFCCADDASEDIDDLTYDPDSAPNSSATQPVLSPGSVSSVATAPSLIGLTIACPIATIGQQGNDSEGVRKFASYSVKDVMRYHSLNEEERSHLFQSSAEHSLCTPPVISEVGMPNSQVCSAKARAALEGDSPPIVVTNGNCMPATDLILARTKVSSGNIIPKPEPFGQKGPHSIRSEGIGTPALVNSSATGLAYGSVGNVKVSGAISTPPLVPKVVASANSSARTTPLPSPQIGLLSTGVTGSPLGPPSSTRSGQGRQLGSGMVEASIDLICLSVASHFKNLIVWADPTDFEEFVLHSTGLSLGTANNNSSSASMSSGRSTTSSMSSTRESVANRLQINMAPNGIIFVRSGKLLVGETGYTRADLEASDCMVTLMIDGPNKVFTLTVTGTSGELVDRRFRRFEALVQAANKERGYFPLKGWRHSHVDCLVNSFILLSEERNRSTTVLMHKYDHTVVAEIVSFDKDRYCSMCQFLESLCATEANWSLARYIFNTYLEARGWRMLKVRYAVLIDKETAQLLNNNTLTCRVYGFNGFIDSALQFVLTNPSPSNINTHATAQSQAVHVHSVGYTAGPPMPQPLQSTGSKSFNFMNIPVANPVMQGQFGPGPTFPNPGMASGGTNSFQFQASFADTHPSRSTPQSGNVEQVVNSVSNQVPSLHLGVMSPSVQSHQQFFGGAPPETYLGPVAGSILFTDKDVIAFYLAFETAFALYIHRVFNVVLQESMQSGQDSMLNSPSVPTAQSFLNLPPTPQHSHATANLSIGKPGTVAGSGVNTPAKPLGPLRVSFHGHNPKDVKSAAMYLEKLNSSSFRSHQVFFPRVDAAKYKELNSYKTQHEGVLRVIRSRALADVAPELASGTTTVIHSNSKSRTRSLSSNNESSLRREDDGNASVEQGSRSPANSENDFNRFSVSDGVDIVDPLQTKGYVHITIKPPLHSRGLKRMTFPADVVICIMAFVNEFELDFRNICAGFDSIECSQYAGQIEVPVNSHLARIMQTRQHRDEFAYENNLVGLRFIEPPKGTPSTQRRGLAGVTKVWVNSLDHLLGLLDHMQYLGGINRLVTSNPHSPRQQQQQQHHALHLESGTVALGQGQVQGPGSGRLADCTSSPRSSDPTASPAPTPNKHQIQGNAAVVAAAGVILPDERSVIRWPHSSFRFMFLGELLKRNMNALLATLRNTLGITTTCPSRDKSDAMACLLLESTTGVINEATERVNDFMNTVLNAMICISVAVSHAQRKVLVAQDLLKIKEIQGKCGVHIILDPQEADTTRSSCCNDLRLPISTPTVPADEMTGIGVGLGIGLGVGVILGVDLEGPPMPGDDGSLSPPQPGQSLPRSEEEVLRSLTYVYPFDLISVGVQSPNGSAVTVSVVNNEVRAIFGDRMSQFYSTVSQLNLLIVLEPQDERAFSSTELEKLNRGDVLVDSFSCAHHGHAPVGGSGSQGLHLNTGPALEAANTVLRVRPEIIAFGRSGQSNEHRVLDGLERAVQSGLHMAESLGLECVLVLAPMSNALFAGMSKDTLATAVLESIIGFIRNSTVSCLRLVAVADECPVSYHVQRRSPGSHLSALQMMPQQQPTAVKAFSPVCLQRAYHRDQLSPYCGSGLAASLLSLLDRDIDPIASVSACLSSRNVKQPVDAHKMELLSLNMLLPPDLNVDAIVMASNPTPVSTPAPGAAPLTPQHQQQSLAGQYSHMGPPTSSQSPLMGMFNHFNSNSPSKYASPSKPQHLSHANQARLEFAQASIGVGGPALRQPNVAVPVGNGRSGGIGPVGQSQGQPYPAQAHYLLPPGIPMIPPLPHGPGAAASSAVQTLISPRIEPPSLLVVQGVPAGVAIALSYLRSVAQT